MVGKIYSLCQSRILFSKGMGFLVLTLTNFTNHESRVTPACRNDALRRAGTIHGDRGTSEQSKGDGG